MMEYDNAEYARFIMPTRAELEDEMRWERMSPLQRELNDIREQMLNGKIKIEPDGYQLSYAECIDCALFHAEQRGEITKEESKELYKQYV